MKNRGQWLAIAALVFVLTIAIWNTVDPYTPPRPTTVVDCGHGRTFTFHEDVPLHTSELLCKGALAGGEQ